MAILPLASTPAQGRTQTPGRTPQISQAALSAAFMNSSAPKISIKEAPLVLVHKASIEKLNEHLASALGENAIQNAMVSGSDFTPEATAERIISQSIEFYNAFKEQHQGENSANVLNEFMQIIGTGIEQGFKEATNILSGLKALNGKVAGTIGETYDLVQNGLQAFHKKTGEDLPPPSAESEELHSDWDKGLEDIKFGG